MEPWPGALVLARTTMHGKLPALVSIDSVPSDSKRVVNEVPNWLNVDVQLWPFSKGS